MKNRSIKFSILATVLASLSALTILLVFFLFYEEIESVENNTMNLVHEQIGLTVKKLDRFRDIRQVDFIAKTVYDLKQVDGINIFDNECNLMKKQPINFKVEWGCDLKNTEYLVYEVNSSLSDSIGYPKYIVARLKPSLMGWSTARIFKILAATLFFILVTFLLLSYFMNSNILKPLYSLEKSISAKGTLKRNPGLQKSLPEELQPIYSSVVKRDEVIQRAKAEAVVQQKEKAVAEMSQQVAHDARFPILVLRDLLLKTDKKVEKKNLYAKALDDLELLTGQLLENTGSFVKEINLSATIQEIVDMKKIALESIDHSVDLQVDLEDDKAVVSVQPTRFKFVLSNIINNAVESLPLSRPGKVKITVNTLKDSFVYISIEDNGQGIKKNDLMKIFKRGVSINKPGGTGLGLSDAKESIESIGGSLRIESIYGKGSKVIIKLPSVKLAHLTSGQGPYDHVLVEDYRLSQLLWVNEANNRGLNFIAFSSPHDFEQNMDKVAKGAKIFVDSHFPDFAGNGQEWAKSVSERGFDEIWLCSTNDIDTSDMGWIKGKVAKEKPFQTDLS